MPVTSPTIMVPTATKSGKKFNYALPILEGLFIIQEKSEKRWVIHCNYFDSEDQCDLKFGNEVEFMGYKWQIVKRNSPRKGNVATLRVENVATGKVNMRGVTFAPARALLNNHMGRSLNCPTNMVLVNLKPSMGVWTKLPNNECKLGFIPDLAPVSVRDVISGYPQPTEKLKNMDVCKVQAVAALENTSPDENNLVVKFIPAGESNNFTNSLAVRTGTMFRVFAQIYSGKTWKVPTLGTLNKKKGNWLLFPDDGNDFGLDSGDAYLLKEIGKKAPMFGLVYPLPRPVVPIETEADSSYTEKNAAAERPKRSIWRKLKNFFATKNVPRSDIPY